jgi:hypothetical protein
MRGVAFEHPHQPMNAKRGTTAHEQVHVIGHDFHLNQLLPPTLNLLGKDNLESFI